MKFKEVWGLFAPNFIGGLMSAILISIILGYNPTAIDVLKLTGWIIGLYLFGVFLTWLLLIRHKN